MKGRIDVEDAILAPLFTMGAAVQNGFADVTIFGTSLSSALTSLGGTSISWAFLIGLLALLIAYATNQPDLDDMDQMETGLALGTVGLVLGVTFVPAINSFILSNDFIGLVVLAVEAAGFYALSYLG